MRTDGRQEQRGRFLAESEEFRAKGLTIEILKGTFAEPSVQALFRARVEQMTVTNVNG